MWLCPTVHGLASKEAHGSTAPPPPARHLPAALLRLSAFPGVGGGEWDRLPCLPACEGDPPQGQGALEPARAFAGLMAAGYLWWTRSPG